MFIYFYEHSVAPTLPAPAVPLVAPEKEQAMAAAQMVTSKLMEMQVAINTLMHRIISIYINSFPRI